MSYHSQWNQDQWLNENVFKNLRGGFFVDVGASDGVTGSNTLFFERDLEWRGICIEPIVEIYDELVRNRAPQTVCINACAFNRRGTVEFNHITGYSEALSGIYDAYNPLHLQRIEHEKSMIPGIYESKVPVDAILLQDVFDTHSICAVDYLSIDTEGSELQVLQGIDFLRTKINVIDVEINYDDDFRRIDDFLSEQQFKCIKMLGGDAVYKPI